MEEKRGASLSAVSRERLEFLFDGIFAIAMTILVLELKVPELTDRHSVAELWRALAHHAPTFASYLLSFLMLGILWYRHNQQYRQIEVITRGMLVLHLVELAAAAFFPFCAALLGRYPTNRLSAVFYTGCIFVYLWSAFVVWALGGHSGAFRSDFTAADYRQARTRALRRCVVVSLLFALCLYGALAT